MHVHDLTHAVWRKSSYSAGGGNECVEVAFPGATALRDSKNPGPVLFADLGALLTAVKSDHLHPGGR